MSYGLLAKLEELESRAYGLVDTLKKVLNDRVEQLRQEGNCSVGLCNELQNYIIPKLKIRTRQDIEEEKAMRIMLRSLGYVHLAYDDLIIPLQESACEWCKQKYGLTGDEHVMVIFFSQDEMDPDREYIASSTPHKVDDLRELVEEHPDESCYFVEAQLFRKVYDNDDNELTQRILTRKFHSRFHMKRIVYLHIADNQYPKQYRALSPFTFEPISYVMEMDTTEEQLRKYVDYFTSARQGRRIEGMRPIRLFTNVSMTYDDQSRVYLHLSPDMDEIMILVANRLSMKGASSNNNNNNRVDCYHTSFRIQHTLMLIKIMNRCYDLVLDLDFSDCVCDCTDAPALPSYPQTQTSVPRGEINC